MKIYNSFLNRIWLNSKIDLVIYHCDELIFLDTLKNAKLVYDYYVVISHFKTQNFQHTSFTNKVLKTINNIPKNKLLVLDNIIPPLRDDSNVSAVYQEFDKDIYEALNGANDKIAKYKKIFLVYPEKSVYPYPRRILYGFRKFCLEKLQEI